MRLSDLLDGIPLAFTRAGWSEPDVTAVTADSREVMPGTIFVAVRGGTVDGHRFVEQALERGASAVVVEAGSLAAALKPVAPLLVVPDTREALAWLAAALHGYPARKLVMIGVTGTDGKTTTSTLIHSILTADGLRAGLISTVGAVIGDDTLDTGLHVTTPDAPALQGYLARMVAAGFTHCVLETTSHGWAQRRTDACEFDVGVITNITHEHLDYHGSYEAYRAAKARLLTGLPLAARKPGIEKCAVLNADDESYAYLTGVAETRRLSYSQRLVTGADFTAVRPDFSADGMAFDVRTPAGEIADVRTPLVGRFMIANILAALAATVGALGVTPAAARSGIAALQGVPGRLERIDLGQAFTAIVDFAHTPNALRRVLETCRELLADDHPAPETAVRDQRSPVGRRLIAVFGSAGLRDVEKRRMMAEVSAELADISVLTAEDPRTESLTDILEMMAFGARLRGAVEGAGEGHSFFRVPDRGEALRLAVRLARPGDIVIACGKGHEQSMCFGTVEYPWDDRVGLRAALAELLGLPGPAMPLLPTRQGAGSTPL
ncbi:MAG: UDP-N-acetylmuramoyl-L-alanyl-D-glutamate--2,6-diaminopimelate ligase [Anaerolineales bacterium]|nr:UDP-N-acetylmuramoyl-L-alanyl-D-glutamate--2,6-diaminopimelate ligase [Anaerolineales bacterium]